MDKEQATRECYCPMCPTYVKCDEGITFCLADTGKSKCISTEKGCLCPDCPVQVAMRFKHDYYCIYGDEETQTA